MADREKKGKAEIRKFEYLENEKSFLYDVKAFSYFLKGYYLVKN